MRNLDYNKLNKMKNKILSKKEYKEIVRFQKLLDTQLKGSYSLGDNKLFYEIKRTSNLANRLIQNYKKERNAKNAKNF